MATREELKLHRHQLYCSVADACQQGSVSGSTAALLSQLQAVLEAESCLSCIEEDCDAVPDGNTSTRQGRSMQPSSKQLRQQQKQRQTPVATPTSKHTAAASAASSAVQLLKDELAHKLHAAVQRSSPGVKAGAAASALVADLAAAQQAQAQLEDRLLAAQAALLQQKQQHRHDLNTWRLAAEQAADLAEAANQRAANCECKLADTAQQLAEQARTTLKLGEELQHARCHLDDRREQEQQLYMNVLRPLLKWQQQHQASDSSNASSPVSPRGRYNSGKGSSPSRHYHASMLTGKMLLAAAAAVEQLLLRDVDKQAAVAAVRQEIQTEQKQLELQLQARAAQVEQELQASHGTVQNLQGQLQQLQADLQTAEQQSAQDKQHMCELQQQLAEDAAAAAEQQRQLEASMKQQHDDAVAAAVEQATTAVQSRAEQLLQQKEEQLSELQQQLAQLFQELAVAQEQAAEAEQQVTQLQVQLEHVLGTAEQQQQESTHELNCRLVQQQAADLAQQRSTLQQLSADKAAALAAAERQAAAALQGAEREHRLAMQEAQQAWERQKAALEQQRVEAVLQARLAAQQQLEKERPKWQGERDALVQKLGVQQASAELQAQRDALKQQQELLQQLQHFQHGRQPPTNQPAAALSWHNLAGDTSAHGAAGAVAPVTPAAATGVGDAVKFSKALTAAESDRRAALKQAAAAQGETRQLRQQLEQQEQELHHLRRALEEMQRACQAADSASREAEASSSASAAALQEQLLRVRQLQAQLDTVGMQHSMAVQAAQQSMKEQVAVIQSDARAELEAAQTRMQLLRLKQQRMAKCLTSSQLPTAADTLTAWRDRL